MDKSLKETLTRLLGGYMTVISLLGLFFNVKMLKTYLSLEKSSFYILCSSKTVSNSLILLIYLGFIAPTNYLYTQLGPDLLDKYINQAHGFGLHLQSPSIQLLITLNRFLVVFISPHSHPDYSTRITVAALGACWLFTVWFSTIIGLDRACLTNIGFDHVPRVTQSGCSVDLTWFLIYAIFVLALFTNILNLLIAGKLVWMATCRKSSLAAEHSKKRLKTSIRFFLQSCFQDWIFVADVANNMWSTKVCSSMFCVLSITMGVDVMVYTVDGLIMYMFYRASRTENRGRMVLTESRKSTRSKISVMATVVD